MEIVAAMAFPSAGLRAGSEAPEDHAELIQAFVEAEWLEKWRAGLLAHEILSRLFKK